MRSQCVTKCLVFYNCYLTTFLDVLCLQETWLKKKDGSIFSEIHNHGLDILSAPRKGRGGGVAFVYNPKTVNLVRNNMKSYKSFEVIESIMKSEGKLVRLCNVYRSTDVKKRYKETKITSFLEEFEEYLELLLEKNGTPFLCGDFNFHFQDANNFYARKFLQLCECKGFVQHISQPTHVSGNTLDLILTLNSSHEPFNISNVDVTSCTGTTSDHYLLACDLPIFRQRNSLNPSLVREQRDLREFQKIDVDNFREDIFCSPLNTLSDYGTVDDAVDLYSKIITDLLDKHAPIVRKSFKPSQSPWWDSKCQSAKTEMRRAQRNKEKNPTDETKAVFKEKLIDKAIAVNRARNAYYDGKLSSVKGDSRGTYKVINSLLDKEFSSTKFPNGESDSKVAEDLKNFFNQKVKDIYSIIENERTQKTDSDDMTQVDAEELQSSSDNLDTFKMITREELYDVVDEMASKSCPVDLLPFQLFKTCLPELSEIILFIVNHSLSSGVFPSTYKLALVRPGLKDQGLDPDVLKNYRPISNLTYISKIIEKVVHKQIVEHCDVQELFSRFQSGYRKHHSCETAITKIHNDLLIMMDKRNNAVLLMLDLSAAFDTINHDLLLNKLRSKFRMSGTVIKWLRSYLSERKFNVKVKQSSSNSCFLEIGVPQGSILGPLLFILFTRDLEEIVTKYGFSVHFYADDTQIYFSFDVNTENPDLGNVTQCFNEIKMWMANNFMKLNSDKTKVMAIMKAQLIM